MKLEVFSELYLINYNSPLSKWIALDEVLAQLKTDSSR